jgi:cellobiose phosphorylase
MILGLLRYGKADKAYEVFKKITPGYVTGADDVKQKCPPYMYANCYYGPSHRNNSFQMEFTWITGSVAWYNTVLPNEMLGVRADYDGLIVDPCLPSSWEKCEIERTFRGAVYHITIRNPERIARGRIELTLDGRKLEGNKLPVCPAGGRHVVEALILPGSESTLPLSYKTQHPRPRDERQVAALS